MENNIDYNSLSKNGLQLSEKDFKIILDSLTCGAGEAMKYLNTSSKSWPKFIFSEDSRVLGYSVTHDAISISINHLNNIALHSIRLEYKDQLLCFIPDKFYIIVKFVYWLKLLSRESTVHRYQKIGNPLLKKQFPPKKSASISSKKILLSDIEVEARKITDEITTRAGEKPIWKNLDDYLSENYPEYFNKSIEEQEKLPEINLPISFEMEYY